MTLQHKQPTRPKSDPGILKHGPLPELAAALRAKSDEIVRRWIAQVRDALIGVAALSDDELSDHVPAILARLADALEASDSSQVAGLEEVSPKQGLSRFAQAYDLPSLMLEDRLLRYTVLQQVPDALGRPITVDEQASLNSGLDVILQRAVVAFFAEQQARLREATEAQLRYLSFLSQDLHKNLGGVALLLRVVGDRLGDVPGSAEDAARVHDAQRSVEQTVEGMRQMLQHETMRRGGQRLPTGPVDLAALVAGIVAQFRPQADRKGLDLRADVEEGAEAESHADVLRLVLQNFVGNAIKYTSAGTVVVAARSGGTAAASQAEDNDYEDDGDDGDDDRGSGEWVLSVSDTGPGIAPDAVERILVAFERGETLGQPGIGLGLSIASQAAKLLGATLSVESVVGAGTTFRLTLPPTRGPSLSPRLRETLVHLLAGDSEKEAAAKMGLSRHTVHLYVTALYRRFGVNSRAELMARFVRGPDQG